MVIIWSYYYIHYHYVWEYDSDYCDYCDYYHDNMMIIVAYSADHIIVD